MKASEHSRSSQTLATIALPLDFLLEGPESAITGTTFCAVHRYEKTGEPAKFERTVDAAVMGGEPVGRAEIAAFENVRPYMDQLVGSTVVNVSGLRAASNGD
jgi:hypothetical protein